MLLAGCIVLRDFYFLPQKKSTEPSKFPTGFSQNVINKIALVDKYIQDCTVILHC